MFAVKFMKKFKTASKQLSIEPLINQNENELFSTQYGIYQFSNDHPIFKGATYQGIWHNGLPHD